MARFLPIQICLPFGQAISDGEKKVTSPPPALRAPPLHSGEGEHGSYGHNNKVYQTLNAYAFAHTD